MYAVIWQVDCIRCSAQPIVGLENDSGEITSAGLCGPCFFGDRNMLDPDNWNEPKESTE
jgi:hypothetical protein